MCRAAALGLGDGHLLRDEVGGVSDPAVDERLDLLELRGAGTRGGVKVEAEAFGVDEGTRLRDVFAHHPLERGLEEVRGGVIRHRAAAGLGVDRRGDGVADGHRPPRVAGDLADVDEDPPARGFSTVSHGEDDAVRQLDLALVANLPAALGVERGGVEHNLHRLASRRRVYPLPGSDDGADGHRLLHEAAVTGEPGGLAELVRDRREEVARGDVHGDPRVAAEGPRDSIAASKPSTSTATPSSVATSVVMSRGKPYVS